MAMKDKIKIIAALVLVFVFASPIAVAAHPRYQTGVESYVYAIIGPSMLMAVPTPAPYRFVRSVHAHDLGINSFAHISEIRYHDGHFFVTNDASLLVLDYNFNLVHEITEIVYNGTTQPLQRLDGVFVTQDGHVYVAEPGGERVIHFDADLNVVRVIGRPYGIPLADHVSFQPIKVAVDPNGRIYVIAHGVFEGIVEINPDGTFNRYFGIISVQYSPIELFWRRFQSAEQRMAMTMWLPVTFSNITLNHDGFVFASLSDGDTEHAVMKLNARGENIIRRPHDIMRVGDVVFPTWGLDIPTGPSVIIDVHVSNYGVFYALDRTRNRVFAYDSDGEMLFAFGGQGSAVGFTTNVTSMAVSDRHLVISDRGTQSLEVFELTAYGEMLLTAAYHQYHADWNAAAGYWRAVLDVNPHFQYAHLGLGRWYYRNGYYAQARAHFARAQHAVYYSMAYSRLRTAFMERHFNTVVLGLVLLVGGVVAYKTVKKVRKVGVTA